MLCFKARQVIVATINESKEWAMNGRTGVSHTATVVVLGEDLRASNLKMKAADADKLKAKVAELTIGKPYEFRVTNIEPVFIMGDDGKRKADYQYVVDLPPSAPARKAA